MTARRVVNVLLLGPLVAAGSLLANTAFAALISRDDPVFGADSLTFDTQSGLEWLDVSATLDPTLGQNGGLRTFSQMSSATNTPGNRYFGFTHANESMINQLLRNSGAFAPTQALTFPIGQQATNGQAAQQLKSLLGWQPSNYLAYTSILHNAPTTFNRRTVFITDPDAAGRVRVNQNVPVNQFLYLAYHMLARPGSIAPPPPLAPGGNSAVQLVTGSPTGIFQSVNTPASAFELAFDTLFETTTGTLEARLNGETLVSIDAPGTLASGFATTTILIDQPTLLGLTGVDLEFVIDGPSGSSVLIDDISFPGLNNGDFESGDLTGWTVQASPNGRAGVVSVDVPAPRTVLVLFLGLALLARHRRVITTGVAA